MQRRTLSIVALSVPAVLAVSATVIATTRHDSSTTHLQTSTAAALTLSTPKPSTTDTSNALPQVTINGRTIPVTPNATMHYNDGTSQTTIQSSDTAQSVQTNTSTTEAPATSVTVTQSNNGGYSYSHVTTHGSSGISITSNSSTISRGGGTQVTP